MLPTLPISQDMICVVGVSLENISNAVNEAVYWKKSNAALLTTYLSIFVETKLWAGNPTQWQTYQIKLFNDPFTTNHCNKKDILSRLNAITQTYRPQKKKLSTLKL